MDLDIIRFHKPKLYGEEDLFRSAVCIPLIEREGSDGDFDILFEVRSGDLEDQPGDICFPGGKIEKGESAREAAIRELCEELLVEEKNLELIGECDIFHTESIIVYPFAGILRNYNYTFDEEVEKVFTVPLEFFLENEPEVHIMNYDLRADPDFPYERINGGRNYKFRGRQSKQLFYQFGEYCIWGLTAKLVTAFAGLFKERKWER